MTPIKLAAVALLAACLGPVHAVAEEAEPSPPPFKPSLSELMILAQAHHAKVWLAGNARNWPLAAYQIEELRKVIVRIATRVREPEEEDIPIGPLIEATIGTTIGAVETAVLERNGAQFTAAFDVLTAACNRCHWSMKKDFIVIQRPGSSAFPNQSFAPKGSKAGK